ncbi:molybdenum cofactor guanylyltransferase [Streptomyces sp. NBC_01216]|uniref:NTP transferase domain-containing protein n=1 Tax=Streptomyces sp. NBC_01216 TaxID=2903778 RepID=UPI002E0D9755|nr:molybdenum cofactor guanylyltransferase [Streptomyces sp. NBC_01216]
MTEYDAVVLAGGAARRLGGVDKPGVRVGGRALLDRVLAGSRGAGKTVVVGGRRTTVRPVEWAREDPPGGGPLAALEAGTRRTTAAVVLVLSADLPFFREETGRRLLDALAATPGADAAFLVDEGGRDQPLVAAYRSAPLRRALRDIATEHGVLTGLPLRLLARELDLTRVEAGPLTSFDCDTWEDIATARAHIREHEYVLEEWITAVKDELGIELDVDTGVLLDLARDAAHGVARPAAPLTTFLVGYAAAKADPGGGPEAVAEAARKAVALAHRWAAEADQGVSGESVSDESRTGQDEAGR